VLAAAGELLESEGYGRLTIEAIARQAGVSKQTIYRWWPNKAAVVLDLLNEGARRIAPDRLADTLVDDLRRFVRRSVLGAKQSAGILTGLMAEAQLDEQFAAEFRAGFLARRREVLRALLKRGQDRGEVDPGTDLTLLVDVMFGALWYRVLSGHAPLSRRFADDLTDVLLSLARDGRDVRNTHDR
jgi:AcrR family transcriptional regulator